MNHRLKREIIALLKYKEKKVRTCVTPTVNWHKKAHFLSATAAFLIASTIPKMTSTMATAFLRGAAVAMVAKRPTSARITFMVQENNLTGKKESGREKANRHRQIDLGPARWLQTCTAGEELTMRQKGVYTNSEPLRLKLPIYLAR